MLLDKNTPYFVYSGDLGDAVVQQFNESHITPTQSLALPKQGRLGAKLNVAGRKRRSAAVWFNLDNKTGGKGSSEADPSDKSNYACQSSVRIFQTQISNKLSQQRS